MPSPTDDVALHAPRPRVRHVWRRLTTVGGQPLPEVVRSCTDLTGASPELLERLEDQGPEPSLHACGMHGTID